MKNKLIPFSGTRQTNPLCNIQTGKSIPASEPCGNDKGKKRKTFNQARLENLILDEFNIDSETMEEHFQELLKYMMHNHNQLIDKIPHN